MKHIKRIIVLVMMIAVLLVGKTTTIGYINYYKIVHDIGLEKTIENIRLSDDYVTINEMSDYLIDATVSVEDKRFYKHNGIDPISIGRAMITNLQKLKFASGGSTITQQLSKNIFLTFDKTFERKATEYFIARKIESLYTKKEILELYINVINYGDGCMGIYNASVYYYQILPKDLTLTQSVLLAGLPQSPATYKLSTNYSNAVLRSEDVIHAMVENDVIKEWEGQKVLAILKKETLWLHY